MVAREVGMSGTTHFIGKLEGMSRPGLQVAGYGGDRTERSFLSSFQQQGGVPLLSNQF